MGRIGTRAFKFLNAAVRAITAERLDGRVLHVYEPVGSVRGSAGESGVKAPEESVLSARELEVPRLHLSNTCCKLEVGNRTEASHGADPVEGAKRLQETG